MNSGTHSYHEVFAKVQKANGAVVILRNNVRGKSAQTRWINSLERNSDGYKVLDSWTLTDGRGFNENGERVS
jgi:hypothetical protein